MFPSITTEVERLHEEARYLETDWKTAEHKLLDFYVRIMPTVMQVERCSIFIANRDDSTDVWLRAGTGLEERQIAVDVMEDSVVGEAIRTGETVYRNNLDQANGIHRQADNVTGFTTRDILCMPIRSLDGTRVTGAVQMLNKENGQPYSPAEIQKLEELLHYLELSIENIYFQQDATNVADSTLKVLRRVTIGAFVAPVVIIAGFGLFLFSFFWVGG